MNETKSSNYHPLTSGKSASETSFWVNFAALLIGVLFLRLNYLLGIHNNTYLFILFALALTVSIVWLESFFYPETSFLNKERYTNPPVGNAFFIKKWLYWSHWEL